MRDCLSISTLVHGRQLLFTTWRHLHESTMSDVIDCHCADQQSTECILLLCQAWEAELLTADLQTFTKRSWRCHYFEDISPYASWVIQHHNLQDNIGHSLSTLANQAWALLNRYKKYSELNKILQRCWHHKPLNVLRSSADCSVARTMTLSVLNPSADQ